MELRRMRRNATYAVLPAYHRQASAAPGQAAQVDLRERALSIARSALAVVPGRGLPRTRAFLSRPRSGDLKCSPPFGAQQSPVRALIRRCKNRAIFEKLIPSVRCRTYVLYLFSIHRFARGNNMITSRHRIAVRHDQEAATNVLYTKAGIEVHDDTPFGRMR